MKDANESKIFFSERVEKKQMNDLIKFHSSLVYIIIVKFSVAAVSQQPKKEKKENTIMFLRRPVKPHLHEQFFLDKFALTRKNCSCRWGIVDKFSLSRKIWRASFSLTRKNCQGRNLLV